MLSVLSGEVRGICVRASISQITADLSISLTSANLSHIRMTEYRDFGACGNSETLPNVKFNAV